MMCVHIVKAVLIAHYPIVELVQLQRGNITRWNTMKNERVVPEAARDLERRNKYERN